MNLPALPMGTIMTTCMIITVLFTNTFPKGALNKIAPRAITVLAGILAGLAGIWNAGWHALRHLDSFWGQMALGSGLLMLFCSALLLLDNRLSASTQRLRMPAVIALALFAAYYALTISRF